ncbi:MAG: histidine kinase [Paludibacteraceae bacterium]
MPFRVPPHDMQNNNSIEHFMRTFQFQELILKFTFVLLLSFLLKTNELWKETREEKRKAELAFLKSQVNPHFLFNTLNGIYALSLEESQKTPEAIVKLSELMRYVVVEIEKEYVLLKNEIDYLQNYIDLQRMRLGNTVKINLDSSDIEPQMKISPLLFIFFVENAFKYGVNTSKVSEIDIQFKSIGNDLYFKSKNEIGNKKADNTIQKGLENVIRRLELIYPQRHMLKTTYNENEYIVELSIRNLQ